MSHSSQKGNVLFLILIAVALFAALAYAVTQSTRSGGPNSSSEQMALNHSRAQSYISVLRGTISRMVLNGTALEDINFYEPLQFNSLTPTQLSQNIFHPSGGNVSYQDFAAVGSGFKSVTFTFTHQVEGVGTQTSDTQGNEILIGFALENEDLCKFVNKKFGHDGEVPVFDDFFQEWVGPYSLAENFVNFSHLNMDGSIPAIFKGQTEACAQDAQNSEYYYYATLVER